MYHQVNPLPVDGPFTTTPVLPVGIVADFGQVVRAQLRVFKLAVVWTRSPTCKAKLAVVYAVPRRINNANTTKRRKTVPSIVRRKQACVQGLAPLLIALPEPIPSFLHFVLIGVEHFIWRASLHCCALISAAAGIRHHHSSNFLFLPNAHISPAPLPINHNAPGSGTGLIVTLAPV